MFVEFFEEEKKIDPKALKLAEQNLIIKNGDSITPEVWEVIQLKSEPEIFSKPSPGIDKLYEDRKQRHELLLSKLAKDLNDVNLETENNIKIASEEVKAHMRLNKQKLDEILDGINIPEAASYHGSVFHNTQMKTKDMKVKQQNLIDEFYEDLLGYEKVRCRENEKIFRFSSEEMRKNGFILPYELQCFIEQETLKMNQLVLNNRRCYEDLRLKLTLNTEETFKSFVDKMFCIQEKWVRHKVLEACEHMLDETEIKATEIIPEPYKRLELKGDELVTNLMPNGLHTTCEVKNWLSNINSVVNAIEKYGINVIELYRKMLDAVFFNFSTEVEDIRREVKELGNLEIKERIIQPILFQAQKDQTNDINDLEVYWQKTLNELRVEIDDVQFLFAIGKLWDKHNERITESKKLILAASEKKVDNDRIELQDLEVKLNMATDVLRQEYDKTKMAKLYQSVVEILDEIKSKLEDNYLGEVKILEEFYKMIDSEADVLSSELKEFIYTMHPLKDSTTENSSDESIYEKKYVRLQIKLCAVRIKKIASWKQGVWKALEGLSQNTKDCLMKRAEPWVDLKIKEVSEKMGVQMEIHCRRYERIKIEMYTTRLREIEEHELNFEKHKNKVEETYKIIKEELELLTKTELIRLNELNDNFAAVEEKIALDSRAAVVQSSKIQMEKKKSDHEERIKIKFGQFLQDCKARINFIRESNVRLMKSMKLFSEAGSYHVEELKSYVNHLETIDKNATAEMNNIEKESNKIQNDILKNLNDLIKPFNQRITCSCDELQFYDEVMAETAKCAKIIQDTALKCKSDFNSFKNYCEKLIDTIENFNPDTIIHQDKLWFCVVRTLYKNVRNIFYPVNLPEGFEETDENVEDGTCGLSDISGRATVALSETLTKNGGFACKDYKPELFKPSGLPENNFTFMAIISNRLWSFMDNLQHLGCVFYRQTKDILRDDLLWPNYDKFAESMLMKFQSYNLQCEEFWLRLIQEFIPLLDKLKKLFNIYMGQRMWVSQNKTIVMASDLHYEFLKKVKENLEETDRVLNNLDGRLLPLHGHPSNLHLLDQLQEDVVGQTLKLSSDWESAIASYQEALKSFAENHVTDQTEMENVRDFFQKIQNALFVDDFGSNLLEKISKYIENGGYHTRKNSVKSSNPPPAPPSTPAETEPTDIPSSYDLSLNSIGIKTQTVEMHLLQLQDLLWPDKTNSEFSSTHEEELNLLIEPISPTEMMNSSLRKLDDLLEEYKWVAESQKHIHDEILFKWLGVWKFNVKKILKLYTVKYPEPEPPPGK